jgi:predicted KAP-like P-loop ATPase
MTDPASGSPTLEENIGAKLITDSPLERATEFNFDLYASKIAAMVDTPDLRTPFTMGIYGKWGTGKTTLMRTIRTILIERDNRGSGTKPTKKIKTIWFNAWKYADKNALLAAFAAEINQEMMKDLRQRKGSILSSLTQYAIQASWPKIIQNVLDLINQVILIFTPLKIKILDIDKWAKEPFYVEHISIYDSFQDYFRRIFRIFVLEEGILTTFRTTMPLQEENGVLVIFIDDLDRCPPGSIVNVLETINLFFDQKGCFFLIGMDYDIVATAIDAHYKKVGMPEFSGTEFIDKMVQLPFYIPPISDGNLTQFVEKSDLIQDSVTN